MQEIQVMKSGQIHTGPKIKGESYLSAKEATEKLRAAVIPGTKVNPFQITSRDGSVLALVSDPRHQTKDEKEALVKAKATTKETKR